MILEGMNTECISLQCNLKAVESLVAYALCQSCGNPFRAECVFCPNFHSVQN